VEGQVCHCNRQHKTGGGLGGSESFIVWAKRTVDETSGNRFNASSRISIAET